MRLTNLKLYLHIFQLEGYSSPRLLTWWFKQPLKFMITSKKPLVMTPKAKQLKNLSLMQLLVLLVLSFYFPALFISFILLLIFPFPTLILGVALMKPYEIYNRNKTIERTRKAILTHPDLTVIGITGSFGKTSTKDFLYEILRNHNSTIKTPQSYNTVFGISRVVEMELLKKTRYFICEMGAYVRGDIKELAHQAAPTYAILTTIGSQHLERFKSIKNTTITKFELIDSVDPKNALVNLDNPFIRENLRLPQYKQVQTYSFSDSSADFFVSSYNLNSKGAKFSLKHKTKIYHFQTQLFGTSNLQNLVAAISMALILKVPAANIKNSVEKLKASPHRLELKPFGKATLIDDAYSSNEQGFTQVINDLKSLKGKKALITPGIVELGNETAIIHQKIGTLASQVFDTVILEGKNERTLNLQKGIEETGSKIKVSFIDTPSELWPTVTKLSQTHDWILLENDLTDNY